MLRFRFETVSNEKPLGSQIVILEVSSLWSPLIKYENGVLL
jgi:hypothetical protein